MWPDVPQNLWSQLASLHERALRRWSLEQELEHEKEPRTPLSKLSLLLCALDWPWWPDEEHAHEHEELEERLPERHPLVASWLQTKLELKRCVCQLLLQVHFEWVWWLLADRSESQLELALPAQEKPLEDLTLRVEKDQSEAEAELALDLLSEALAVAKLLLAEQLTRLA